MTGKLYLGAFVFSFQLDTPEFSEADLRILKHTQVEDVYVEKEWPLSKPQLFIVLALAPYAKPSDDLVPQC